MKKIQLPEDLKGKTVLVAGAAGFIPSHLCAFYLELGAKVIGIDNFITGTPANIERLSRSPHFEFYEANIYQSLPDFKGQAIDFVLSLASPASPVDFERIPLEIMRTNAEGTRKLLDLAQQQGARFLEASTSEVYGDPEVHPQSEDYTGNVNPIGKRAPYDESKRFAEAMTMAYHRRYGLDTRIVRIFNTYGPGMRPDDGRVIPNFITQALSGRDLTIYGDGEQTRSFCFVSDLVEAIHRVLFSDDPTPFNCGNPDEYTVQEVAEKIVQLIGSTSVLSYRPLPYPDEPRRRRPNMDKLWAISDVRPRVSLSEGLSATVEFFKGLKNPAD